LGDTPTSYIPTNGSPVTRTVDIAAYGVVMSMFKVYGGVHDYVGPMGRRGLLGLTVRID
jgi:hypothetical protein